MMLFRVLSLLLACINPLVRQIALFIQYIPEDTIRPRWFLVQVNHHETEVLKLDSLRKGDCHVTFLSRHPADKHLYNGVARWWPG